MCVYLSVQNETKKQKGERARLVMKGQDGQSSTTPLFCKAASGRRFTIASGGDEWAHTVSALGIGKSCGRSPDVLDVKSLLSSAMTYFFLFPAELNLAKTADADTLSHHAHVVQRFPHCIAMSVHGRLLSRAHLSCCATFAQNFMSFL